MTNRNIIKFDDCLLRINLLLLNLQHTLHLLTTKMQETQ